jgi:hypothetical protein
LLASHTGAIFSNQQHFQLSAGLLTLKEEILRSTQKEEKKFSEAPSYIAEKASTKNSTFNMQDFTVSQKAKLLQPLIAKALDNQPGFLEFYLRDQSRLPGARANLELAQDFSQILAFEASTYPHEARTLLNHLVRDEKQIASNTPSEFVLMCGVLAFGYCAAFIPVWRLDIFPLLTHYACSLSWRVREATALALQKLLLAAPSEMLPALVELLARGDCLQQRACLAAVSEPSLLKVTEFVVSALAMQRSAIERLHALPITQRRQTDVRVLRQTLSYTLGIVTAACPDSGFALMCEIAAWNDPDINWILRENIKKRRLAKFSGYTNKILEALQG